MLVTDDRLLAGRDPVAVCRAAERGGVTAVQLRLKDASPRETLRVARALVTALSVPVLLNDRPDLALAAGAAGVHLGADDLPVALARRVLPPAMIVGASVGDASEVPNGLEADYWGIGPWRTTTTKPGAGPALGAEGFRRLVARAGGRPCIAIGGVRPEDVPTVIDCGGVGVAVVSGILATADVETAARAYRAAASRSRPAG